MVEQTTRYGIGNLVVYPADEPGKTVVAALDPVAAMELTGNERVWSVAYEVRVRLERVLAALG